MKRIPQSGLKELRKKVFEENPEYKCPLLNKEISFEGSVVDHAHRRRKKDPISKETGGLIRGIIDRHVNAFLGRIENNYIRHGLDKYIDLPTLLRNIADYIENPPMYNEELIHPSERLPEYKMGKREFKKFKDFLINKYPNRKTLLNLEYFQKIPKRFQEDFKEFKNQEI